MNYPEFEHLLEVKDNNNPFCKKYVLENGEIFYIEPVFYTQMQGFKEHHPKEYQRIIDEMMRVVLKNKKVVFVGNFEFPQTEVEDDFIFYEITDITNPLHIFVEDKSRGSDYGD